MSKLCEFCEEEIALDGPYCSDCYIDVLEGWEPVRYSRRLHRQYEQEFDRRISAALRAERLQKALPVAAFTLAVISFALAITAVVIDL